jgi:ankyrin repeat protein
MQADSALLEVAAELTDCARYGEDEEIQQLLAAASSPADLANTAASNGNVALHMAAANGHTATCELLLQAGANVNIKNSAGNTPLHWGALNGHLAAVNVSERRSCMAHIVISCFAQLIMLLRSQRTLLAAASVQRREPIRNERTDENRTR